MLPKFVEDFIHAVPEDRDHEWFDKVLKPQFLIMVLKSTLPTFDHEKSPDVKKCVDDVINLWQRDGIGSDLWRKDTADAAAAAYSSYASDDAAAELLSCC